MQPLLADIHTLPSFVGRYFATKAIKVVAPNGVEGQLLLVSDASREMGLYFDLGDPDCTRITPYSWLRIEAKRYQHEGKLVFIVQHMSSVKAGESIMQMPRAVCPMKDQFDMLVSIICNIQSRTIRQFVVSALMQPQITMPFLYFPLPRDKRFNHPGGLLERSVKMAFELTKIEDLKGIERDVIVAAALLQHVGQLLESVDSEHLILKRNVTGICATSYACRRPLKHLAKTSPEIANEFRHAWQCLQDMRRKRVKPKSHLANCLVQTSERYASEYLAGGIGLVEHHSTTEMLRAQQIN